MKTIYLTAVVVVMALLISLNAGGGGVPLPPVLSGSYYLNEDFEADTENPLTGVGIIGDDTVTYDVVDTAAPFTGESKSLKFGKEGTTGYIQLYGTGTSTPMTPGLVVETVFKVNDDIALADKVKVLRSPYMTGDFWVESAGAGKIKLGLWSGNAIHELELNKNDWHKIQALRTTATGGSTHILRYFVDDKYWRTNDDIETESWYNNRIYIGDDTPLAEWSITFDHLQIYDGVIPGYKGDPAWFYDDMEGWPTGVNGVDGSGSADPDKGPWCAIGSGNPPGIAGFDKGYGYVDDYAYGGNQSFKMSKSEYETWDNPDSGIGVCSFFAGNYRSPPLWSIPGLPVVDGETVGYDCSLWFYFPTVEEQKAMYGSDDTMPYAPPMNVFSTYDDYPTYGVGSMALSGMAAKPKVANPDPRKEIDFEHCLPDTWTDIDSTTHMNVNMFNGSNLEALYVPRGEWVRISGHRYSETGSKHYIGNVYMTSDLFNGDLPWQQNAPGYYVHRINAAGITFPNYGGIGEIYFDDVLLDTHVDLVPPAVSAEIDKGVAVTWSGNPNSTYKVEFDDGGWQELATVHGNTYADMATTDPSARTYRATQIPTTYFEATLEDMWYDKTVGGDQGAAYTTIYPDWYVTDKGIKGDSSDPVAFIKESTLTVYEGARSFYAKDKDGFDLSGHSTHNWETGVPHQISLWVRLFKSTSFDWDNWTVIAVTKNRAVDLDYSNYPAGTWNSVEFTDVKIDLLGAQYAYQDNVNMTVTYGDGLGGTTTAIKSVPTNTWFQIIIKRTAQNQVSAYIYNQWVVSNVPTIDDGAEGTGKSLFLGDLTDTEGDAYGWMYMDNFKVSDLITTPTVVGHSASQAVNVSWEAPFAWNYAVEKASSPAGPWTAVEEGVTRGVDYPMSYGESISGVGKSFYRVNLQ